MKSLSRIPILALAPLLTLVLCASTPPAPAQGQAAPAPTDAKSVRFVTSKDGTKIAFDRIGAGPTLVLVAPALAARSDASRLAELLSASFTVVNFDRRGRGASGDAETYAVQREVEDIAALVDDSGGSAFLFGSSSGAVLALEAANELGAKIKAAVLFEPPFIVDKSRPPIPEDCASRARAHVVAGQRGAAVALFMKECIRVPADMLEGMQQSPMWAGMEQLAHTLPYDMTLLSGLQTGKPLPKTRWTKVSARTLVLDGEKSDEFLRNSARALAELLPGSRHETMAGQDHSAMFTAPQVLVPVLVRFLAPGDPATTGSQPKGPQHK